MKRLEPTGDALVPSELCAFDPAEWPGGSWDVRFRAWCQARLDFLQVHGWKTALRGPVVVISGHLAVKCLHHADEYPEQRAMWLEEARKFGYNAEIGEDLSDRQPARSSARPRHGKPRRIRKF